MLSHTFTVMTFNLLGWNRRLGGAVASIAGADAGVVALQELTQSAAQVLGEELRPRYPYQALRPDTGFSGGGVLSRFPILWEEPLRLSERGHTCQHLALALPGRELHCFNVHLTAPRLRPWPLRYDATRREAETAALAQRLAGHPGPLVVMGDFNMTDRSAAYHRLARLLGDAFREAGAGPGKTFPHAPRIGPLRWPLWPAPYPIIRIDYIFHSREIATREAHLGDGDGSDHCPVIATLAFAHP